MAATDKTSHVGRDQARHPKARCPEAAIAPGLKVLGLLVLTWAMSNCRCFAVETDSFRLHALQHYNITRCWDNVDGPPVWVCGVSPKKNRANSLHTFCVGPGQQITIRLPARSMVRVLGIHRPIAPHDIELWVSDGSGLYSKRTSAISQDHRSLFLVPDSPRPCLARIRRPPGAHCGIEVAVFTSRWNLPRGVVPYQEHPVPCAPKFKIRRACEVKSHNFFCLRARQARVISVEGPLRVAIETRFRYPRNERRSFQTYRLRTRLNGIPYHTLDYETGAETRLVLVDGHAEVLGRQKVGYLDIPAGSHRLEIGTTADVYARLLSYSSTNYLLRRNQPTWLQAQHRLRDRLETARLSSWNITPQAMELLPSLGGERIASQEQLAYRSARDNGRPEGGLRSMMLMRTAASYRPDEPTVRQVAEQIRGFHTFFRNLLPFDQEDGRQQFAWFSARGLRVDAGPAEPRVIAEQHIDDLLNGLSSAFFTVVGRGPAASNQYRLPTDLGATLLRVVVDRRDLQAPTRMLLQYDRRSPIELEFAHAEYESDTSTAEIALAALHGRHGGYDHGTLGGPFSLRRAPAQLIPVATTELRVPPDIRQIRLWTAAGTDRRIRVALQYRASKPFQLSESEFLAMLRRSRRDASESFRSILNDESTSRDDDFAIRELTNHWLPLVRLLQSKRRSFEAQVVPLLPEDTPSVAADEIDVERLVERGRQLAVNQDWLPCLEVWSDVLPHTSGSLRREGLLTQTTALRQLGEALLADRTLRGLYLFDGDPAVRTAAFQQLRQARRRSETTDSLAEVLATATAKHVEGQVLNELTDVLLGSSDDELALMLSLVTPEQERSHESLVQAAYRVQWWEVFEREMKSLSPERRSYWRAMRMQCEGDYPQALRHFRLGGTPGQVYAAHLASAIDIHARLQSASPDDRVRAILDWEQWQTTHPGPRVWQDAGWMVHRHAGTESLYSIDRDLYAQFYKSSRDRPVVLRVQGPQNLRFECRPIHPRHAQTPRDDWIQIYTMGGHRPIAVNGNRPSSGLQIVGDGDHLPGWQVPASLALGPGRHEIKIASDTPLLVRVFAERPALPIRVLPTLTPDTLAATADRGLDVTSTSRSAAAAVRLISPGTTHVANSLPLVHQSCPPWRASPQRPMPGDPVLAARLALRTGDALDDHAGNLVHWARHCWDAPAEERALALARLGSELDVQQDGKSLWEQLPLATAEALLTARHDYKAILALPLPDDASIRRRATLLLWLAESEPEMRNECRVVGQRLFRKHPAVDGLSALHSRLTREGTWSRVTQLTSSAGVRQLQWPRWLPESPPLRVRKSLVASLKRTERLLFSREATVLSMRNFEPVQLKLSLGPAAVGHLPSKALLVACQLGDSSPHWISVQRDGPRQDLQLEVPAGLQYLRLWVDEPTAHHYVRLDLREVSAADPLCIEPPDATEFHTTQRFYDVATHDEPVRMLIEGPAWLRVDELRDETTHTRYIEVVESRRQVELTPGHDQEEALFRIFQYLPQPGKQLPPTHWVQVDPEPLPPPLIEEPIWDEWQWVQPEPSGPGWSSPFGPRQDPFEVLALRAPDSPVIALDVYDDYPLSGQDGTWSISLGAFSRRALEEGLNGGKPDRFLETRATYRHCDVWTDAHRRTDLLVRPRNKSGPTLGVLHRVRRPSHCWPVVFELEALAFAQDPAGAIQQTTDDIEWSATIRGRLRYRRDLAEDLYHTASLSVYGRVLSQDEVKYFPGRVDQDIFTIYKANHLGGMILSDTWVYKPWIDTRWWIRPSLITNEDFNPVKPDQVNLRIGWAQALGLAEVDASYRLTRFFQDRDRRNARWQNLLYLDAIMDIPQACTRSELAFRVQHDLDRGSTSALVSLSCYFDKGRLERNRWPGERAFPAIRQQREVALLGQASRY